MGFWNAKQVLVTGGSGFIGSHLVELLVQKGAIVTATSRKGSPEFLAGVNAKVEVGDLNDKTFCERVAKGKDIIMHLAACVGGIQYNSVHHASLYRDNLLPFMNMIEAARQAGTERFLTTSSACVYPRDCTIPTPEEDGDKDLPEPTNEGYGMAKRAEEYLAMKYAQQYGMKIAIARPYNAYGPRDDFEPETSHVIPALIRRIIGGEDPLVVWGSGKQTRAFLYVEDVAEGLMHITEKYAVAEPLNIGTDNEITIHELVKTLFEVIGIHPHINFDTTKPEGQLRRNCDTKNMIKHLSWKPETSLTEGLRRTVAWYRETQK